MWIKNTNRADQTVNSAYGELVYDEEGVADVPDELAKQLLELPHYQVVAGPVLAPPVADDEGFDVEEDEQEEEPVVIWTPSELRAISKDQVIDVAKGMGLRTSGTKKDLIKRILDAQG